VLCLLHSLGQISIASSSVGTDAALEESWRPARALKYHLRPTHYGTGKGQSSVAHEEGMIGLPFFGSMEHAFFLRALQRSFGSTLPVLGYSPERTIFVTIGAENLFQSVHVNFSAASTRSSAACWGVVNIFAFKPGRE